MSSKHKQVSMTESQKAALKTAKVRSVIMMFIVSAIVLLINKDILSGVILGVFFGIFIFCLSLHIQCAYLKIPSPFKPLKGRASNPQDDFWWANPSNPSSISYTYNNDLHRRWDK